MHDLLLIGSGIAAALALLIGVPLAALGIRAEKRQRVVASVQDELDPDGD